MSRRTILVAASASDAQQWIDEDPGLSGDTIITYTPEMSAHPLTHKVWDRYVCTPAAYSSDHYQTMLACIEPFLVTAQ